MKLKFMLAAIVGFVVFTNGSYVALAQTGDVGQVYEIKSKVQDRIGNKKTDVKVEKFDGTKIKGKITQAGDSSFTILESKSNQSTVIAYSDTKKVKGSGWPTSAKIAIGVGIAAAVTFIAFGIAFQNATRDN